MTDKPIGVSKPMCDDCKKYFQALAKYHKKDRIVKDPEVTRIFKSDGSVLELYENGKVISIK